MDYVINGFEPKRFFEFFEVISAIPRSSGKEKQISDYLVDFAKRRNLEVIQDDLWNVIIKKPASLGAEQQSTVMLQGHLDMVCEKNNETIHDFDHEGIKLIFDGQYLKAKGTTLGADNGVAIAIMMTLLDDSSLIHPPLECVFTVQEETGLTGAENLDVSVLKAKTMINLDSETEGIATVSCAGGARVHLTRVLAFSTADKKALKINLGGLLGGHSGCDIGLERGNSNLLMGRLLRTAQAVSDLYLAAFSGGNKDNAIPRECEAIVAVEDRLSEVIAAVKKEVVIIKQELSETEPDFWVKITEVSSNKIATKEATADLITLLTLAPNGVFNRNTTNGGFVVCSANLGIIDLEDETLRLVFSLRSSVDSLQQQTMHKLKDLAALLHFNYHLHSQYQGWAYREQSPIRDLYCQAYEEIAGRPLICEAIHAGLECGLFLGKMPYLDAIAVGPQIDSCHTPQERLDLSSCALNYRVLTEVLARLATNVKQSI